MFLVCVMDFNVYNNPLNGPATDLKQLPDISLAVAKNTISSSNNQPLALPTSRLFNVQPLPLASGKNTSLTNTQHALI